LLHNDLMLNRTSYTLLTTALAPVAVARLLLLSRKHAGYGANIAQRFGRIDFSTQGTHCLWLHAVSVGEVIASEPFVNGLMKDYPDFSICITNTTPTGAEQVARSFSRWGDRIHQTYAPYDLPGSIERFLDKLRPVGLVLMETELWPNWLAAVHERGVPCLLMNARMSEKSFRGYQKLGKLATEMMSHITVVSAQTRADAEHFETLGAANVKVTGSLKSEYELSDQERDLCYQLAKQFGIPTREKVVVAGSTHEGEEPLLVEAFMQLWEKDPGLRLVLAPRHPDRCKSIALMIDQKGLGYRWRTQDIALDDQAPILLCDKLGELRAIYGLGKLAFIGGTLIDHGGHNPLEPAAWGMAISAGSSQRNFDQIFNALEESGAMHRVSSNVDSLVSGLSDMLLNPQKMASAGESAMAYMGQNRGAREENLGLFKQYIGAHIL